MKNLSAKIIGSAMTLFLVTGITFAQDRTSSGTRISLKIKLQHNSRRCSNPIKTARPAQGSKPG